MTTFNIILLIILYVIGAAWVNYKVKSESILETIVVFIIWVWILIIMILINLKKIFTEEWKNT